MTRRQPLLAWTALAMIPLALLCLAGLTLDTRVLAGAPLWLKPLKFSLSVLLYTATLTAMLQTLPESRLARWLGNTIGGMFVIEMVCVVTQAARGRHSHFNIVMPDRIIFQLMGIAILIVWLLSAACSVLLWRHSRSHTLKLALALGVGVSVLGGSLGALMLAPSPEQREILQRGEMPELLGHHTVGAPDGGPGMPLTNWSITHGDLRVAHFVGLHGMQVVPFLTWLLFMKARRPRSGVVLLAASYTALTGIILWQAYRAQPLIHPDTLTLRALVLWASLSIIALVWARGGNRES